MTSSQIKAVLILLLVKSVLLHEEHQVKHSSKNQHLEDDVAELPTNQDFFIDEIFDKYGSAGVMSFEGFEHLLENLGLGRLAFDKNHNVSVHHVNGTFKEVHDLLDLHHHTHDASLNNVNDYRTRRSLDQNRTDYEKALEELSSNHEPDSNVHVTKSSHLGHCLSPQDILLTFGLEPHHAVVINPLRFLKLCPAIVYELDQRSCYHHEQLVGGDSKPRVAPPYTAWLYASLSVLVISLMGLFGVAVVPLIQKAFYKKFLQFLVALAVGTLCGDALLHLLPHALMPSHGSSNDHTTPVLRATVAFLSLTFFFLVEAVIRYITSANVLKKIGTDDIDKKDSDNVELGPILQPESELRQAHGHQHYDGDGQVTSVAWMVIMGDGLHNLTDGLAIGAAFANDHVAGFATTLAVFCHELPHEIGDFAVLLQSGMSIRRALAYNVFSSVLSFMGMAVGVWIGDHDEAALWIYAATAGTFLYISLADLIPEMNSNLQGSNSPIGIILQIGGIMTGGGIMLAIALYEDSLRSIFN